ncbi:hypothetical protein N7532_001583 [Penicillium argentinense]|uniref:Cenp-O kinetochore centromere component n=1 Tax=Penicillium argentinense TaxID=1131581 RepID=A0A9W9G304_9EURO|nr:uncharacterized protein N7532_001583 [Penicillium argentinense]KAJ5111048.1 hypothetical protein N7532_001583 [Penicillium argentinense]
MNQSTRRPGEPPDPQEQELDEEIRALRAEIQTHKNRKRILSTALLSTPTIQSHLQKPTTLRTLKEDLSPLATAAGNHSVTNHHRIAFGATAFPFKDPSPSAPDENLLGVRIDVCARNGRFAKPYYVLLKRERAHGEKGKRFRVYRHTIPTFISVGRLEGVYLSFPSSEGESDEEEGPLKVLKAGARKQDLRGFVRELRREVVAWHVRTDAVESLREKLGLGMEDGESAQSPVNSLGIVSLEATAIEARYVRMEYEDGRVGRFKLSNSGIVERAIFMNDHGRDKKVENAMVGQGGRVETLFDRLKSVST